MHGRDACYDDHLAALYEQTHGHYDRHHGAGLCDCCEDYEPEEPPCPACEGETVLLGVLGTRVHFRCRACGIESSHDTDPRPVYDDDCFEEG